VRISSVAASKSAAWRATTSAIACEAVLRSAHDLDRKRAGEFEQADLSGDGGGGGRIHGGSRAGR